MNPLQIAEDYARKEGYDFSRNKDGTAYVWHPCGAARIRPDGLVESESNPRLKTILEKKIAQSRAQNVELNEIFNGGKGMMTKEFLWDIVVKHLHILSDRQLTNLIEVIRVEQKERENDKIAASVGC